MSVADWLGEAPEPLERPDALARLARRYLAGHGPADAPDLARWAGITLGDARIAFGGIEAELAERPGGLVDLADRDEAARPARPAAARTVRPAPARLGLPRSARRRPPGHRHVERTVPRLRARRRPRGRDVDPERRGADGEAARARVRAASNALRADAADVLRFLGLPDDTAIVVA